MRYIGILPAFITIDGIHAWVRELRGHDEPGAQERVHKENRA